MFTGLVEEKGSVVAIEPLGDSVRLTVRGPVVCGDVGQSPTKLGDSIAVNGCCLTVADLHDDVFTADVMAESLNRTSLADLTPGATVNLERAVAAGDRLGGHIVQGHVDGVSTLLERLPSEHWEIFRFALPAELGQYLVEKGSITVDGVSLTVVDVGDDSFAVSLIPTTLADTILGTRQPGDRVNLEVDVVAKYVERMMIMRDRSPS
jgi:riboflavin synthase